MPDFQDEAKQWLSKLDELAAQGEKATEIAQLFALGQSIRNHLAGDFSPEAGELRHQINLALQNGPEVQLARLPSPEAPDLSRQLAAKDLVEVLARRVATLEQKDSILRNAQKLKIGTSRVNRFAVASRILSSVILIVFTTGLVVYQAKATSGIGLFGFFDLVLIDAWVKGIRQSIILAWREEVIFEQSQFTLVRTIGKTRWQRTYTLTSAADCDLGAPNGCTLFGSSPVITPTVPSELRHPSFRAAPSAGIVIKPDGKNSVVVGETLEDSERRAIVAKIQAYLRARA